MGKPSYIPFLLKAIALLWLCLCCSSAYSQDTKSVHSPSSTEQKLAMSLGDSRLRALKDISKDIETLRKAIDVDAQSVNTVSLSGTFIEDLQKRLVVYKTSITHLSTMFAPYRVYLPARQMDTEGAGKEPTTDEPQKDSENVSIESIDDNLKAIEVAYQKLETVVENYRKMAFLENVSQRTFKHYTPTLWVEALHGFYTQGLATKEQLISTFKSVLPLVYPKFLGLLLGCCVLLCVYLYTVSKITRKLYSSRDSYAMRRIALTWYSLLTTNLPVVLIYWLVFNSIQDLMPQGIITKEFISMIRIVAMVTTLFIIVTSLIRLLNPRYAAWGTDYLSESTQRRLYHLVYGVFIVSFVCAIIAGLYQISVSQQIVLQVIQIVYTIFATALVGFLRCPISEEPSRQESASEKSQRNYIQILLNLLKVVERAFFFTLCACLLLGYLNLGVYFVHLLVNLSIFIATLCLLFYTADQSIVFCFRDSTRVIKRLQQYTTLSKRALLKIGLITQLLARALLIVFALYFLQSLPYEKSDNLFTLLSIPNAFISQLTKNVQRLNVAGVEISLSSIMLGVFLFLLVMFLFRCLKYWLENVFLPETDLNKGLKNSLIIMTGYLGFIISCIVVCRYIGVNLEKVAILASALSVGIGFGLQSIVNNFVSGILLLWEQQIKVGDYIAISGSEGIVKKISVRSTLITTKESSDIIIPNSNLISNVVLNKSNNSLNLKMTFPKTVDPNVIMGKIEQCVRNHKNIVQSPSPNIKFIYVDQDKFSVTCEAILKNQDELDRTKTELDLELFKVLSTT